MTEKEMVDQDLYFLHQTEYRNIKLEKPQVTMRYLSMIHGWNGETPRFYARDGGSILRLAFVGFFVEWCYMMGLAIQGCLRSRVYEVVFSHWVTSGSQAVLAGW
jgi:hypothetical protein